MKTIYLPLDEISIDGGTQARAEINASAVAEYAEVLTEGESLPPALVFFDGVKNHLADGFHRFHANRRIGATSMECEVRTGTLLDARLYAYGANKAHGLQRSNADKRKAVAGMLADFSDWSDRQIAKHVGVGHPFVAAVRSPAVVERQKASRAASAAKVESDSTPAAKAATATPEVPPAVANKNTPQAAAPEPRDETIAAQAEQIKEQAQELAEAVADIAFMGAVFEADDKLAEALKQNKQLRAEVSGLRERVNGLMNEKNEAVRMAKSWQRRAEKAEKAGGKS